MLPSSSPSSPRGRSGLRGPSERLSELRQPSWHPLGLRRLSGSSRPRQATGPEAPAPSGDLSQEVGAGPGSRRAARGGGASLGLNSAIRESESPPTLACGLPDGKHLPEGRGACLRAEGGGAVSLPARPHSGVGPSWVFRRAASSTVPGLGVSRSGPRLAPPPLAADSGVGCLPGKGELIFVSWSSCADEGEGVLVRRKILYLSKGSFCHFALGLSPPAGASEVVSE